MYQQLLYPRIDDIDKYLALLQSTPDAKRMQTRFAPAWKARRYEIEVLADRAQKKCDEAKRIGVIHDTISFKSVRIPRTASAPYAATARLRTQNATNSHTASSSAHDERQQLLGTRDKDAHGISF